MRWRFAVFLCLLAATPLASLTAGTLFTFEGFPDSALLTNQYSGLTFANAIILSTGITLDEFEYPPHSGSNVASDNGGPMTIVFATPAVSFAGYFTYSVPLTVQAFDSANNLVMTASSAYSNNEALSGAAGSQPNQLLQVSSSGGISKIVIAGSPGGTSFTVDDITVTALNKCDINVDGTVNVLDAQAMIDEALGAAPGTNDLNGDGVVTVVDIQIVINAALQLGCAAK